MRKTVSKMQHRTLRRTRPALSRERIQVESYKEQFSLIEPQINADGVHVWPFDLSCPVDVQFWAIDGRQTVRMNRHEYFEVMYLLEGSNYYCHIQDKLLPMKKGDLVIMGSTLYHRMESRSTTPATLATLYFDPELIRSDGGRDSMEYLTPFMCQGPDFPHIISIGTSIPNQVFDLMLRIRSELPSSSPRSRVTVKTYLKMILVLLMNYYAPYTGTVGTFERQQRALDRLVPLFNYIRDNSEDKIQVREAARLCNMSESHFMSFFKQVTGASFMKYLNYYRVERSKALLANTDEPMASICQKVGFCDQSYFGMVFHKLVGVTPAAYRRSAQGQDTARRLQMDHTAPDGSEKLTLAEMLRRENVPIRRRRVTSYSKSFLSRSGT